MFWVYSLFSPSSKNFLGETATRSSQTAAAAADGEKQPTFSTWDLNLQRHSTPQRPLHATKPFPPLQKPSGAPGTKFLQRSLNFLIPALRTSRGRAGFFFPHLARGSISIFSILTGERKSLASACQVKSVTETSNDVVTATASIYKVRSLKRRREKNKNGCCTYSWPVSVPCLWTSCCQSFGVGLCCQSFFYFLFFLL